jgi:hypothetical protein
MVVTFTNIYRGSQSVTIALLYAYKRLFPFKTDTIFPHKHFSRLLLVTVVKVAGLDWFIF